MSIYPPITDLCDFRKQRINNEPTRKSRKGDKNENTKAERLDKTSGHGDPEGGLL
jgi:hypothetical protein